MKNLLILLLITLLILSGCGGGSSPKSTNAPQGSLTLNISESGVTAQTIQPNTDMTIATYDISGSGPNGTSFHNNNVIAGSTITIKALAVGNWVISVDAKNTEGILIAAGVSNTQVVVGAVTSTQVIVRPLIGTGDLSLAISWPDGVLATPSIIGTLTPIGSGDPINLSFLVSSDQLSASSQNNGIIAGYYSLQIKLLDGGIERWGAMDIVRIIAGQTSTGGFSLTTKPGNIGKIELVIIPDLQNPITIQFSGQQEHLTLGSDMTVTATPSEQVDSYQWYLNGELISDEIGQSLTIGSSLAPGSYRLDVIVMKGTVAGAASVSFNINEPFKVAYIAFNHTDNNWLMALWSSLQTTAQEKGIELISYTAENNITYQIASFHSAIAQGVNVICHIPIGGELEPNWNTAIVNEAKAAGIPVLLVSQPFDWGGLDKNPYTSHIYNDFALEGEKAANWLVAKMGANTANIIELEGPSSMAATGRKLGFDNIINAHPNMHLLTSQLAASWLREDGKSLMENLLVTYPTVNVVYAHNDLLAIGAIEAIKEAGKVPGSDIILVSIDGARYAFNVMIAGDLDCTVECSPIYGPIVFATIERIRRGESIEPLIIQPENVYTKETAAVDILNRPY